MSKRNMDSKVYGDYYIVKDNIWREYYGFADFYKKYVVRLRLKLNNRNNEMGMINHAIGLSTEIEDIIDKVDVMTEDEIKEFKQVKHRLLDVNAELNPRDFHFLREFFADFLFKSGIRDITTDIKNTLAY